MEDLMGLISFIEEKEKRKDINTFFSQITNSFIRNEELNVTEKIMYIYLKGYGDGSFPSQKTIMKHLQLSKPTIIKTLDSLQSKGYLYVHRRFKGKEKLTNLHFLAEIDDKTGKPSNKDFVQIQKLLRK